METLICFRHGAKQAALGHPRADGGEVIYHHADADQPNMGLTSWKDAPQVKTRKFDVVVAKNYLTEVEMAQLSRVVNAFARRLQVQERMTKEIADAIEGMGSVASTERPLAWMMLETNRETFKHELRVKYWPGPDQWHLLAEAQAHGSWVHWLAN